MPRKKTSPDDRSWRPCGTGMPESAEQCGTLVVGKPGDDFPVQCPACAMKQRWIDGKKAK